MKKYFFGSFVIALCSSFFLRDSLKGTWEYEGGIYNGKPQGPTKEYTLQRKYDDTQFQSFVIAKDEQPKKYEAGNYQLNNDTCIETQTFSIQPSKTTGKPLKYFYKIVNDTLVLNGSLPSGMTVIEYWKKLN